MHHASSRNTRGIDTESGLNLCKFVKFFEYIYIYISQLLKQQADKDLKPALTPLIGFVHRAYWTGSLLEEDPVNSPIAELVIKYIIN